MTTAELISQRRGESAELPPDNPWLPLVLCCLLAAILLGVAAYDEPLHIDELTQVGYYTLGVRDIVDASLAQTQPPLDYLLGAATQAVFGPSDIVWRSPALIAAMAAVLFVGLLLYKMGAPAWLGVLLMALTPTFLEFSAYARPYALPLALMVGFLMAADVWRRSRSTWALVMCFLLAVALPLSRTTEPTLFLILVVVTFGIMRWRSGRAQSWVLWPGVAAFAGLLVAFPVLMAVSEENTEYQAEGINSVVVAAKRIVSDIAPVYLSETWLGWIVVSLGLAGFSYCAWSWWRGRAEFWWIIPLGLVGMLMPIVFAFLSQESQPYWPRYTYFFIPIFAIGASVLLASLEERAGRLAGFILVLLVLTGTAMALSEQHRPDYHIASDRAMESATPAGDTVIWELNRSLDLWRPTVFPGGPVYIDDSANVYGVEIVARGMADIDEGSRPVILAQGFEEGIAGWTSLPISPDFALWFPDHIPQSWTRQEQADTLWSACLSLNPDIGAAMCAVSVRIEALEGEDNQAGALSDIALSRIESESLRREFASWLADIDLATANASVDLDSHGGAS